MLFPSIPVRGSGYRLLEKRSGLLFYSPKRFPRYLADLTSDFETYLNTFGSKSKATLRRKVRKFQQAAKTQAWFRQYRTPEDLQQFYTLARELSKRTYQEKLLDNGLPDSSVFKEAMLRLASNDSVRAYTLHLEDDAVAYLYCPVRDGILYYAFLGYDPESSSLSTGTVLQYLAFEQLFAEKRFRLFDFEEGEGQHKRQFSTDCIQCSNLLVLRSGLKSYFYIACDLVLGRTTAAVLRVLDKLKLRTKVRQMLR